MFRADDRASRRLEASEGRFNWQPGAPKQTAPGNAGDDLAPPTVPHVTITVDFPVQARRPVLTVKGALEADFLSSVGSLASVLSPYVEGIETQGRWQFPRGAGSGLGADPAIRVGNSIFTGCAQFSRRRE